MPNKYQLITELMSETLQEITKDSQNWIKFLDTASHNYKYSFNEQVLIYAQKPEATACADIEIWNKRLKRLVNKGAKGIALISIEDGKSVLRHVFDISDTHSLIGQNLKLWEINPSYENGLIETLENSFGTLIMKEDLGQAIFASSLNLAEDNAQDYLVDLKDVLENSLLQDLSDEGIESYFKGILGNSIAYIVMKRCGIDPMQYFNVSDFECIKYFNTKSVISRLGAATSDISEQELKEISSSVLNFEKNKNRTFAKKEETNYYVDESKNNNKNIEGRDVYDENRIQTNGRLSNTTGSITTEQEIITRQVFKNEREIPKRIQEGNVRGIDARGQNGGTLGRDRTDSSKEIETNNSKPSTEESNKRRIEGNRSDEVGSRNEQHSKSSRGNDNDRASLQLNLFDNVYIPPIKELPTVEKQQNNIQKQAEIENKTNSAFSFTQNMIDNMLLEGSHFEQGKFRIYEQFQRSLSTKENIDFLKKEYGDGGSYSIKGFDDIGEMHSAKGILLHKGFADNRPELMLTWLQVEKRIGELVKADKYLDQKEKEEYQRYLDDKNNIVRNEKANEDVKAETVSTAEKSNDTITDLQVGQVVYLESDRKYRVEAINKELDKVVLLDLTMLEKSGYPITRDESYLRAISLYKDNERNFPKEKEIKASNSIKKELQNKINYHIENQLLGEGTPKEKVQRNIAAIKLLKKLENENRLATKEEQDILVNYVGWGGLPDVFDKNKENWKAEYNELKELLTDEEYKSARASTLTAFYTPPIVINAMYQTLSNMGLEQANILEPSCATGNFFGMLPETMQKSKLYGVELDSISGRIAKQLYQNADITISGYEKTDLPDSFFDVAIGNVPFGDFKVNDERYDKNNFLIHDYFFGKTLDKVRPGGVVAFVTSKGTMDKASPEVRKYIAQRAELLGAIRLPDNTFTKNAGTKVTSDIIFLQKRENLTDIMPDWVYTEKYENDIAMNKYFIEHPEMILGNMEIVSTAYGYDSTCKAKEGISLEEQLKEVITNIHGEISNDFIAENDIEQEDTSIPAKPNVKNFSYTIVDDKIYFRENSRMILQDDLPVTAQNRIRGLISLREQVRELIDLQMKDYSEEHIHISQAKLNQLYDMFTKEYGLINSRGNESAFSNDSSYFLLCSLEKLDGEGKFVGKADIFSKRTIKAKKVVTQVDTPDEALILSIQDKARVDLDYMQKLCGMSIDKIIEDLKGAIFNVPDYENLLMNIYQAMLEKN